jgi:hypothetical protein
VAESGVGVFMSLFLCLNKDTKYSMKGDNSRPYSTAYSVESIITMTCTLLCKIGKYHKCIAYILLRSIKPTPPYT